MACGFNSCAMHEAEDYNFSNTSDNNGEDNVDKQIVDVDDNGYNSAKTMQFNLWGEDPDKEAYVRSYSGNETTITVPAYIRYKGKRYTVTATGDYAFKNSTAQIINFPATIKVLSRYSFQNAKNLFFLNLKSETPPELEEYILSGADNCVILVPENKLNSYKADKGWSAYIDRLSIHGDNSWINKVSKNNAGDVVSYVLSSSKTNIAYADNDLNYAILTNGRIAVYTTNKNYNGDFVVPGEIRHYFRIMPIEYIYDKAFQSKQFKTIQLPSTVKGFGPYAFSESKSLESISLPKGVTELSYAIFANDESLKTVNLPNTLTIINQHAFNGCKKLMEIYIPTNVTKIESNAFTNCSSLRKIVVPASVKELDSQCFYGCSELNTIQLNEGLQDIGQACFYQCKNLYNIDLPASLNNIGQNAFAGCTSLEIITCYAKTPPSIGSTTFSFSNSSKCVIRVPASSVDAYKQAPNWRNLASRIQGF